MQRLLDTFETKDKGLEDFDAEIYRLPFGSTFGMTLACVTQGVAEGALQEYTEQMKVKADAYLGNAYAADPLIAQRVATADAIIRGNRLRFMDIFHQYDSYLARGEPIPVELRARGKLDLQYLAKTNVEAVNLIFKAAGGSANRKENHLQRYFRDIQIATNHAFLNFDKGSVNYGGILLGAENADIAI